MTADAAAERRAAAAVALDVLGPAGRADGDLGALTTYRVGGTADVLVEANTRADLAAVVEARRRSGLAVLVVGRGSNLLVADTGFAGIAVVLGEGFAALRVVGDGVVEASGALALPVLARRSVALGFSGLEWAVGVPGTVGGGVRMNAGGHGSDMAEVVIEADLFDLTDGSTRTAAAGDLGFRFRGSDVGADEVVVAARLAVQPATGDGEALLAEIVRWRRANQPGGQNAGSVFVNPRPESAGAIIDELGLRGFRIGTAEVSPKHANFIQADEGGTAGDVRAVIEHVRAAVAEARGIHLRTEIRMVGFPS